MRKQVFPALCLVFFAATSAFAGEALKLATTTSTYETGLLDYILPPFQEKYGVEVHIISVGTGKAIKLAENGDVDLILVHAKEAEEKLVKDGCGKARRGIMYNNFVILGPGGDPARVSKSKDVKDALRNIARMKHVFVSRGDDSGTDKKEKSLWRKAGLEPCGGWYLETGQGMSATLRIADEKNAYVMLDRATYLFNKDKIRLSPLTQDNDRDLFNPYGVIAVNPEKNPHVKYKSAVALIEWLVSPECQGMIDTYRVNGKQLFFADAIE
ncbi:MAG: substrate-binding domain-containing protein [Omnitrophica bacterium]|nr:substrate-binding domain-containing protein [Candidatus Omnitrophota bacterium]